MGVVAKKLGNRAATSRPEASCTAKVVFDNHRANAEAKTMPKPKPKPTPTQKNRPTPKPKPKPR